MDVAPHTDHNGGSSRPNQWSYHVKLSSLFSVIQRGLDSEDAGPGRFWLANGMQEFVHSKFALEGEERLTSIFFVLLKRCALLWKLLPKDKHCSQRLLLKLDYTVKLTSKIFNEANMDLKLILGDNADVSMFILDVCVSVLQLKPGTLCVWSIIMP